MKIESKRLILRNWEDGDIEDIVEELKTDIFVEMKSQEKCK